MAPFSRPAHTHTHTQSLDEVNITIETCEFGRAENLMGSGGWQSLTAPKGKYNFIDKIIDGITVTINTVNVKFNSPAFTASVQLSRIRVESKTPKWLNGDLRVTRLKDTVHGHLLIFKEVSWQTVRIEASSTQDKSLTPLRLLTNQARCRITIKKKLADCTILASRLVLILDDLLWVLTDSQLNAALHFVDSLTSLIKASTNLTQQVKAKKILERLPEYQEQIAQQNRQQQSTGAEANAATSAAQKSFDMFDVKETSYHFFSQRIDLHLCDDAGSKWRGAVYGKSHSISLLATFNVAFAILDGIFRRKVMLSGPERRRCIADFRAWLSSGLFSISLGKSQPSTLAKVSVLCDFYRHGSYL